MISGPYSEPCQTSERRSILDVWLCSQEGFGCASLHETKKFIVLNSVSKTYKIEKYWIWIKSLWLDWPSVKQFSLFEKFSLFFVNKKVKYLGGTLKSFSKFVAVRSSWERDHLQYIGYIGQLFLHGKIVFL